MVTRCGGWSDNGATNSSTSLEAALSLDYQLCEPTNALIVLVSWRL